MSFPICEYIYIVNDIYFCVFLTSAYIVNFIKMPRNNDQPMIKKKKIPNIQILILKSNFPLNTPEFDFLDKG